MPIEKVKISNVSVKEYTNERGKSFLVKFTQYLDQGQRTISGFVPANRFNSNEWKDGEVKELEVSKNEKGYWNFKLAYKPKTEASSPEILEALKRIEETQNKILKLIENSMTQKAKDILQIDDDVSDGYEESINNSKEETPF